MESLKYNKGERKEFLSVANIDLSPLEHRFIGGSEIVGDTFYDGKKLKKDFDAGNISTDWFTPLSILKAEKSIEQASEGRNERYLKGIFSFLGESGVDLFELGYTTIIELPQLDVQSGTHSPYWRLTLLRDGVMVHDKDMLNILKPKGVLVDVLNFEIKDDGLHISYKNK